MAGITVDLAAAVQQQQPARMTMQSWPTVGVFLVLHLCARLHVLNKYVRAECTMRNPLVACGLDGGSPIDSAAVSP